MIDTAGPYVLVFFAMVLMDIVWAQYTAAVGVKALWWAPVWAVLIILFSGFVTSSYVANLWMLIPAGAGAYAGTWLSIWWDKRKQS